MLPPPLDVATLADAANTIVARSRPSTTPRHANDRIRRCLILVITRSTPTWRRSFHIHTGYDCLQGGFEAYVSAAHAEYDE